MAKNKPMGFLFMYGGNGTAPTCDTSSRTLSAGSSMFKITHT